jgi:protein arginine kinase activator
LKVADRRRRVGVKPQTPSKLERIPGVKCQLCTKPATVHLTDIVNGQKKETHLCQACAEQQQLVKHQELNLPAILQTLIGQHVGAQTDELSRLKCPACGLKYMEFRAVGRLGCPHDYDVFRAALEPLLRRIHRSVRHVGKAPHRRDVGGGRHAELVALRLELQKAVETEQYEEAARIRDLLRKKEAADEPG